MFVITQELGQTSARNNSVRIEGDEGRDDIDPPRPAVLDNDMDGYAHFGTHLKITENQQALILPVPHELSTMQDGGNHIPFGEAFTRSMIGSVTTDTVAALPH
jgi:hypothetical protein